MATIRWRPLGQSLERWDPGRDMGDLQQELNHAIPITSSCGCIEVRKESGGEEPLVGGHPGDGVARGVEGAEGVGEAEAGEGEQDKAAEPGAVAVDGRQMARSVRPSPS